MLSSSKKTCCALKSLSSFFYDYKKAIHLRKSSLLIEILNSKYICTGCILHEKESKVVLRNNVNSKIIKSDLTSETKFPNIIDEFRKFYRENADNFMLEMKEVQIKDPRHKIDMLFTFETEENLKKFVVTTDSAHDAGYSSASLKVTQDKTALFSGNICTEIPKTGNVRVAGYANIMCHRKVKSFGRPGYFDWRYYTHLVLKIKGDGRTYSLILNTPLDYQHTYGYQFSYPLYTRGGPYWQIAKIPFSHFFFATRGKVSNFQAVTVPLNKVAKLGITLADGIDGPFNLEIDYIGLEKDSSHLNVSPYEHYFVGRKMT